MPLNEQSRALLESIKAAGQPPAFLVSLKEARQRMETTYAKSPEVSVGQVWDETIPCPRGGIRMRIYRPKQEKKVYPAVVFIHGGGWTFDSVETHDTAVRLLCRESGCMFLSVDYRMAPEHKFPEPLEDVYTAVQWTFDNIERLGGARDRIAICGDSAGGNLAAAVCLLARDRGSFTLKYQYLIYPALQDGYVGSEAYELYGKDYYLTRDMVIWTMQNYLRYDEDRKNPYVFPLCAKSLAQLPPAHIVTAQYDPLHDDGVSYASRLRKAGVSVTYRDYPGLMHGFINYWFCIDEAMDALRELGGIIQTTMEA